MLGRQISGGAAESWKAKNPGGRVGVGHCEWNRSRVRLPASADVAARRVKGPIFHFQVNLHLSLLTRQFTYS
jgi:hypothetical protein